MKSECDTALGLLDAIFTDVASMYPSAVLDFTVDREVIRRRCEEQGFSFFAKVLPDVAGFLHGSLDAGFLLEERPALTGRKTSSDSRPRFLWDLWSRIFDSSGTLLSEVDSDAILSIRQLTMAFKKYRMDCDAETTARTVDDFLKVDTALPKSWEDTWDSDVPSWSPRYGHPLWGDSSMESSGGDLFDTPSLPYSGQDYHWSGLRRLCGVLSSQLGAFDPYGSDDNGNPGDRPGSNATRSAFLTKHGPGAVYDRVAGYVKYDLPRWTHRLESVFPYDYFGSHNYAVPEYVRYEEYPSRLLAVQKTLKAPRLIAAEPTCHQWIQGGIETWLRQRLRRTFLSGSIDFEDQSVSQRAALEASRTGEFATVDLSSASDRLSTRLVEYCFQANRTLLDALHACRTRVVEMPNGELHLLRKFATMGSACTFPVQTIVFSLLGVYAVMLTRGVTKYDRETLRALASQVRVFGDDIIVPVDAYPVLGGLLTSLGLKVNSAKSFAHGWFRESCGMDAYKGEDVTPAYFRTIYSPAPADLASVVECSNNFHLGGWWNAAHYVLMLIPEKERKLLGIWSSQTKDEEGRRAFGLTSFVGNSDSHLTKRWNRDLHRREVKILDVRSKSIKVQGQGNGSLLQFFFEEPSVWSPYRSGQATGARIRKNTRWVRADDARELLY